MEQSVSRTLCIQSKVLHEYQAAAIREAQHETEPEKYSQAPAAGEINYRESLEKEIKPSMELPAEKVPDVEESKDASVEIPQETPEVESISSVEGFLIREDGAIIGCDGAVIVDGVLVLPSNDACTGVASGAFSCLGNRVLEIYLPANITNLEQGAFDGLTGLFYIEADPENPCYKSIGGVLYCADGATVAAMPPGR